MTAPNAGAPAVQAGDTKLRTKLLDSQKEQRRRESLDASDRAAEAEAQALATGVTQLVMDGGFAPLPESGDNADPKSPEVVVRFRREVEEMSFGRTVIAQPVYDNDGQLRKGAVLGGIRYFSFDEGRRYQIPREMAEHLHLRGIVYDYE